MSQRITKCCDLVTQVHLPDHDAILPKISLHPAQVTWRITKCYDSQRKIHLPDHDAVISKIFLNPDQVIATTWHVREITAETIIVDTFICLSAQQQILYKCKRNFKQFHKNMPSRSKILIQCLNQTSVLNVLVSIPSIQTFKVRIFN